MGWSRGFRVQSHISDRLDPRRQRHMQVTRAQNATQVCTLGRVSTLKSTGPQWVCFDQLCFPMSLLLTSSIAHRKEQLPELLMKTTQVIHNGTFFMVESHSWITSLHLSMSDRPSGEKQISHPAVHSPKCLPRARSEQGPCSKPGTRSRSSTWVAGTQLLVS